MFARHHNHHTGSDWQQTFCASDTARFDPDTRRCIVELVLRDVKFIAANHSLEVSSNCIVCQYRRFSCLLFEKSCKFLCHCVTYSNRVYSFLSIFSDEYPFPKISASSFCFCCPVQSLKHLQRSATISFPSWVIKLGCNTEKQPEIKASRKLSRSTRESQEELMQSTSESQKRNRKQKMEQKL